MIKLIVNDVELDLRSDTIVALTKKSVDIGNLQNRWSSYTNKFSIPATKKNREALGVKQFQDKSGAQYDYQNGKLISGGLEIASNVLVIIESVSEDIFLTLRAGNGTLFDRLNKTKLSDLTWDDLNHVWDKNNVWLNSVGSYLDGYAYPIHQTGAQSISNNTIEPRGMIPFIYVKSAFERMQDYFGYNFTGDTYSLDMFERLSYPIVNLQIPQNSPILNNYLFDSNVSYNIPSGTLNDYSLKVLPLTVVSDPSSSKGSYSIKFTIPVSNVSADGYRISLLGKYRLEFSYSITVRKKSTYPGTVTARIFLAMANTAQTQFWPTPIIEDIYTPTTSSTTYTGTIVKDFEVSTINNNPNQYYFSVISTWTKAGLDIYDFNSGYFKITKIEATETNFGGEINISSAQPDITCGKFIKEVGNIFGAIYDVDEFSKTIEITRLDEIATNKAYAYNWSDKLDLNQSIDVTYKLDGIGKNTNWQWINDEAFKKTLIVDNDQLPDNAQYVKSDADYSNDTNALKYTDPIFTMTLWENSKINMDGQLRFSLIKNADASVIIFPLNSGSFSMTGYKVAYFSYPGSPYSLDWEDLYDLYYADLLNPMTERIQRVECYVRLNDLDIQSFRFKYPVYIKHFNRYFFVDEISEYTGKTQSTKVILVGI